MCHQPLRAEGAQRPRRGAPVLPAKVVRHAAGAHRYRLPRQPCGCQSSCIHPGSWLSPPAPQESRRSRDPFLNVAWVLYCLRAGFWTRGTGRAVWQASGIPCHCGQLDPSLLHPEGLPQRSRRHRSRIGALGALTILIFRGFRAVTSRFAVPRLQPRTGCRWPTEHYLLPEHI